MHFDLHRPCTGCPFLKVGGVKHLGRERAREIAECLTNSQGGTFPCHKTVDYSKAPEDGESWGEATRDTQHCAGALLLMEKVNPAGTQIVRIAERLGLYDRTKYVGAETVYDTVDEFIEGHASEDRDSITGRPAKRRP